MLEHFTQWLVPIGLLLDIVGVVILGWDVLRTHRFAREMMDRSRRLRHLQITRDAQIGVNYQGRPPEVGAKFAREIEADFNPQMADVWKEEIAAEKNIQTAPRLVCIGPVLLVFGFLLQLIGVLLTNSQ